MQTFIPYGSHFAANARVLDRQRLGKQRVEGLQIIRTLLGINDGWANHPAVKMWEGHEEALGYYTIAVCDEWTSRGYKDSCADKIRAMLPSLEGNIRKLQPLKLYANVPEWLNDPEITLSHKSNLVRKLPGYYGTVWPNVPDDLPYKWPV